MVQINSFKDLEIWKNGHKLTIGIYTITKAFPVDEKFGLSSQLRRASVSICSNIAEGYMKSTKDFIRYLDIARGSLEEVKYQLLLSKDLQFLTKENYDKLFNLTERIGKMSYSLKSKLVIKSKNSSPTTANNVGSAR